MNDSDLPAQIFPICLHDFFCSKLTDRDQCLRLPDRVTHQQSIRRLLETRRLIRKPVQNQIMNRRNKGDGTEEGNVKMRRKQKMDS